MGLTVMVHTVGAVFWFEGLSKRLAQQTHENKKIRMILSVLTTTITLLLLHLTEAIMWAIVYMKLPAHAGLDNFHDAFYFSIVTFTSLGYGDITLHKDWQLLAGMEAMVGITAFGITTALLFAVIQRYWKVAHAKPKSSG